MKNGLDAEPSLICLMDARPEAYEEFLKEAKKKQIVVREIKAVNITIPLNEKYDTTINWIKSFTLSHHWRDRNPLKIIEDLPMMIRVPLLSKMKHYGFKPLKTNFNWDNDAVNPLLGCGIVPLLYQDQEKWCDTPQEKNNMKRLETLETDGYKSNRVQHVVDTFIEAKKETNIV